MDTYSYVLAATTDTPIPGEFGGTGDYVKTIDHARSCLQPSGVAYKTTCQASVDDPTGRTVLGRNASAMTG